MAEIAARPRNGLRVASTFSGCGGSSLGYKMAGYSVVWASEFVPAAQDTYRRNHAGTHLSTADIRSVSAEQLLAEAGVAAGELDILDGSPPCASFSTAGSREKGWGKAKAYSDTEQRTDDLFFEFSRLLRGVRPRAFVAENVSGLVKGTAKGYFKLILRELRSCGYDVEARVLDAQWLGVPQARQRLIFIGVRLDVGRRPAFPAPLPYRYSLADALDFRGADFRGADFRGGFYEGVDQSRDRPVPCITTNSRRGLCVIHDTSGSFSIGDVTDRPSPTVTVGVNSVNSMHLRVAGGDPAIWREDGTARDPETGSRIDIGGTAIEREPERFFNLREAMSEDPSPTVTAAGGGRGTASVVIRSGWQGGTDVPMDRPSPTVMAGGIAGSGRSQTVVKSDGRLRKFTLGELRRVCGFPDDFVLTGSYAQRWERLGRAVPPPMMAAIAAALRDKVLAPCAE